MWFVCWPCECLYVTAPVTSVPLSIVTTALHSVSLRKPLHHVADCVPPTLSIHVTFVPRDAHVPPTMPSSGLSGAASLKVNSTSSNVAMPLANELGSEPAMAPVPAHFPAHTTLPAAAGSAGAAQIHIDDDSDDMVTTSVPFVLLPQVSAVYDDMTKLPAGDARRWFHSGELKLLYYLYCEVAPDIIVASKFCIEITQNHLQRLFATHGTEAYLSDELINFYMLMLQERDTDSLCMGTFFYKKLMEEADKGYCFANVVRWFSPKKMQARHKTSIFDCTRGFIPIHIGNHHWTLIIIDFKKHKLLYYDSLGGYDVDRLQHVLRYLVDMGTTAAEWTLGPFYGPQQENGYDCGMYVLEVASALSRSMDAELNFTPNDITELRKRIILEIVVMRLA
jgi:hypothetical protein